MGLIWKNCKHELDSIFDEVSENRNCDAFFLVPPPPLFFGIFVELQEIIKSWLGVAEGWSERFWKAEGPYFLKIKSASTKLQFFTPFRTQNGIIGQICTFWSKNAWLPFGLQKCPNFKSELGDGKYGPWAFQNRARNVAATSRSIFGVWWKIFWRSKIAKITIFTKIDPTSKICKKWLRGRSGIPGRLWKD